MKGERYVALGVAFARSGWFTELARWSTSAVIPVEFVKCVSVDEVRAHLRSGRAFSALLVDAGLSGVDRDLVDEAKSTGCGVVIIDDGRTRRDWTALGASILLPGSFTRTELLDALQRHTTAIVRSDAVEPGSPPHHPPGEWRGHLVAVTGASGTGASTACIALAQGLARDVRFGGLVVLADLALHADQAMLHHTRDVVPAIEELVEAHRGGDLAPTDLRSLTFAVPDRGYHLLLGLRRHRDWVSIRPRAFDAAIEGLQRAYKAVICDLTADFEGESQCGSIDVEERNLFARVVTARADVVVVVGLPGPKGLHRMVRVVEALVEHHVDPSRILPVVTRAPRNPRMRAELTSAYAELVRPFVSDRARAAGPVYLPERRRLEDLVCDGVRLPGPVVTPLTGAVSALLDELHEPPHLGGANGPVAVAPGSLGSWTEDEPADAP